MKTFSVIGVFVAVIALAVACTKTVSLPEYRAYQNDADVPRISAEDAKKDVDAGIAVIVDARDPASYKAQHITGSINFPLGSTDDKYSTLPKDKKIIVYCSWPNEHTSASLAFQMNQKQIANTYALKGGTAAWMTADYPTEKGQ